MKKQDGALKRAEFKALRALDPLMAAWNALQTARSHPEEPLDVSKCITLVEAAVAALGQAEMGLEFQRRVNIVGKVMRDFKKAKEVVLANAKILEKDSNFLFGEKFEACLIKSQNFRRLSLWARNLLSRGNEFFWGVVNFNLDVLATMRSPFQVAPARTINVVGTPSSPAALHRRAEAGQYP